MSRVGYNKVLGLIFLPLSILIMVAGLSFGSISGFTGLILTVVSIGYLTAPAVTYGEEQIELKNMLGMTVKRYIFGADDIRVEGGKIYVNGRKFKVQRGMCVASEFDAMVDFVADRVRRKGESTTMKQGKEKKHPNLQQNSSDNDDFLEVF